jgi:hypothetical protein
MNDVVEHARRELSRRGEEAGYVAYLLAVVAAFDSYDHGSAQSRQEAADTLAALLRGEPLSVLTADPAEWQLQPPGMDVGPDGCWADERRVWRNVRDGRAWSIDGGRTYRLDGAADTVGGEADAATVYTSVPPRGWVVALREMEGLREDAAAAAVWQYLAWGPVTVTDRLALQHVPAERRDRWLVDRWGPAGAAVAALMLGGGHSEHSEYGVRRLEPHRQVPPRRAA